VILPAVTVELACRRDITMPFDDHGPRKLQLQGGVMIDAAAALPITLSLLKCLHLKRLELPDFHSGRK
jgi:hypothetical protein